MEKFRARILRIPEMAAVARHLSDCTSCRIQYQKAYRQRRNYAPISIDLSSEFWFRDDHLEYEQMLSMVHGNVAGDDLQMINAHLGTCARCNEDLRQFRSFVRQITPAIQASQQSKRQPVIVWWKWPAMNWKLGYVAATVIAIIATSLLALLLFTEREKRRTNQDAASNPTSNPAIVAAASPEPTLSLPSANTPVTGNASHQVVSNGKMTGQTVQHSENKIEDRRTAARLSLQDDGRTISVAVSGKIAGLDDLPLSIQESVRDVLLGDKIAKPGALNEIILGTSALRGVSGDVTPFKLLSPLEEILAEDRPGFRWELLTGATSYQVHLVALGNREVLSSPELSATTVQWVPETPLKRGTIYRWTVTAIVNGEEVISPAASAPEARFGVLDETKRQELAVLKRAPSHLALGIFYTRAGMLSLAEREFQQLAQDNPKSQIAIQLLRQVRSWR